MAVRCSKNARVSTQKSHTGRKNGEKAVKNSTPPPTAPSSRYSRSCPCARRSMKRKTAKPAAMQYRMSSADVRRAIPFSTCPSTMSITPLISGTPGIR